MSAWPIATTAPYRTPMTASVRISGVKYLDAAGNSCRQYLIMPNVPTLSSTPTSSTAAPGWADVAASGSQVWNGHSGALIANAMKNPRNSQRPALVDSARWVSELNRNVPGCPPRIEYTYSAITATSMSRPPSRLYRRNLTAAYWRWPTPKLPIMKYIGTSMASKNT